ncbi:uncharacterized protein LOC132793572 [Drosophila nasuta]|uniref:Uncharacterized protein LOC117569101 n=1 Tax=Drosophila albomicans TaxID=7291 RepID=A0A6P8X442_DROAB|nr:uncharacterized protein LOC117569101 [Drosophila albomicans]XP_060659540.1 uncharacterized protein LOC132793572 [Drosophila nasuta]
MVYSIKNSETGEFEYFYTDSARVKQPKYDEETGEPVNDRMKVRYRKHGNFHVPRHFLRGTICDEVENVLANKYQADFEVKAKYLSDDEARNVTAKQPTKTPGYEREDYIEMDGVSTNIILGYERNKTYLLFLIPTLFCWSFVVWWLLSILEIVLHMMAHKKNSLTMQKNLYFRSPMHVLSSQFCAICRNEYGSKYNRTFDILNRQMRLAHRSGALKDMAKAMG